MAKKLEVKTGYVERFTCLKPSLAFVLVFVGGKAEPVARSHRRGSRPASSASAAV